ncbi:glycine cleavage system aminomethyltransferase GcvT [Amaricoccus solimangrovi]|uniref:aminomethyltransferase n=1 Tax=Amaricoccus solimangrovi TaxID=2589815 RepID=A0A501X1E1_9RHOB|nr:glycine cleavage system aminomethyltransferase GcvT [Amaricoccus solimangrovi]TPE53866.1 glycine cleavage system aminomethyltransferase GcvT [Amaricoccus solimangrovi]
MPGDTTTSPEAPTSDALARTPLHGLHVALGARMVPFAGYEMPVQYPAGILKEHLATREAAGLFDVSHMGQFSLRPKSGAMADLARAFEALVPVDALGLREGRQRYGFLTNAAGGIEDDLMFANRGDHFLVVVNAARRAADAALMEAGLGGACEVEPLDRGLVALQGPAAEAALAALAPEVAAMRFTDVRAVTLAGTEAVVSRSGYTGEDGFEISVPAGATVALAEALLARPGVAPVGLGARDSLRLEAGLCLYGHDIDAETTPVEAALEWAIQPARRRGGARPGGFPGAERILAEIEGGAARRRVGLRPEGRAPMREGVEITEGGAVVGAITSGGFGPSLNAPVAMGYVPTRLAAPGTRLGAILRGKDLPVTVSSLPFVRPGHRRG